MNRLATGFLPSTVPSISTDPELLAALHAAAGRRMSAAELRTQRLSWVRGQADVSHSEALRVLEQHWG